MNQLTYNFEYPLKGRYGCIHKENFSLEPLHISGYNALCGYLIRCRENSIDLITNRENSTNVFHVVRNGEQLLRWLKFFNIK